MAGIGFKKQFVPKIMDRSKEWTIRDFRKRPIRKGERLFMYTGMRTKHCKKIGEAICLWTSRIVIHDTGVCVQEYGELGEFTTFGNNSDDFRSLDWFATRDGFKDWNDLKEFWYQNNGKDCFPYEGTIIRFEKVRALRKLVKK